MEWTYKFLTSTYLIKIKMNNCQQLCLHRGLTSTFVFFTWLSFYASCASSSNPDIFAYYIYKGFVFSCSAFCKLLTHSSHSLQAPSGDDHESWIMGLSHYSNSTKPAWKSLPWPPNKTNELDIHGLVVKIHTTNPRMNAEVSISVLCILLEKNFPIIYYHETVEKTRPIL